MCYIAVSNGCDKSERKRKKESLTGLVCLGVLHVSTGPGSSTKYI